MSPLVSIIVATYRRERILCETLRYLLAQDYSNCELILVDQSPQHEADTLEYLASINESIRYVRLEMANLPAARNEGIAHSSGDIIVFFDDDVVVQPDCISRLVETYRNPEIWSATGFVTGVGATETEAYLHHHGQGKRCNELSLRPFRSDRFIGCFMSFRRAVFDKIGYFDEWIGTQPMAAGEDIDFCRRLLNAGFGVYVNPAIIVHHLGAKSGGCTRRALEPEQVRQEQIRMNAYIVLKNRKYSGLLGWIDALGRCYRQTVLVHTFYRPWRTVHHHAAMGAALRDALRFKPNHSTSRTGLPRIEKGAGSC